MKRKRADWHVCPACGKKFLACAEVWGYKRWEKGWERCYCSWTCLRTRPDKRVYIKKE